MISNQPTVAARVLEEDSLDLLDRDLREKHTEGYWAKIDADVTVPSPRTGVRPNLWRWTDVYPGLVRAGELVTLEQAERRTARLLNPGLLDTTRFTTHTLQAALQFLKPGERAPAHHHTQAGIRFVVQGRGAYTTVNGQRCTMEVGDLVLTPQLAWHDHANDSTEPMVWLDGLDLPLILSLQQMVFEPYAEARQQIVTDSEQIAPLFRAARPTNPPAHGFFHYKWRDTAPALQALIAEAVSDPFDGYLLEYQNPLTGGPTLPTMQCAVQLLHPRHTTEAHRHTSTVIYHVVQGRGSTFIEDVRFDWERGDTFVVPLWHAHRHLNRSDADNAVVFSMTDAPVLRALELYREEAAALPA